MKKKKVRIPYKIEIIGYGPDYYWWRIVSTWNGQILLVSEGYTTKAKAKKSALRFSNTTGINFVEAYE